MSSGRAENWEQCLPFSPVMPARATRGLVATLASKIFRGHRRKIVGDRDERHVRFIVTAADASRFALVACMSYFVHLARVSDHVVVEVIRSCKRVGRHIIE